jgi:hypothetical protein
MLKATMIVRGIFPLRRIGLVIGSTFAALLGVAAVLTWPQAALARALGSPLDVTTTSDIGAFEYFPPGPFLPVI